MQHTYACYDQRRFCHVIIVSGVTRGRGSGGRTAPGDTLQGVTPEKKFLWANLQRIVEKRGRTGKKVCGDTLKGVTPE